MKAHNTPVLPIAILMALASMPGCSEKTNHKQSTTDSQNTGKPAVVEPVVTTEQETTEKEVVLREIQPMVVGLQAKSARLAHFDQAAPVSMPLTEPYEVMENRDNYLKTPSNGVYQVISTPLSTFSIDVDTGSYANVRSYLNMGRKPPADAIREEAFINYFDYQYSVPDSRAQPFTVQTEIAPALWSDKHQLLRIALKGYDIPNSERKPSNLVFLVDVSGSMNEPNKLPLLVQSLSLLSKELGEKDTVSIVTYAGKASVVLEPTKGTDSQAILNALKSLSAGGGTYGESGIKMAYQQVSSGFIKDGINRVILATDGDFNVGVTGIDALKEMISEERKKGISLTTLGFGRGNYNDALMEQLADIGDGNHAYIDTLHEAKKVLLRQMSGTLQSIASDVKIQIEFNPETVKEYRLIGYQNRLLKDEDFNNDKVDAGEIGAGHAVTAFYELTLAGDQGRIDDLRYQKSDSATGNFNGELAQMKVRYKLPGETDSSLITRFVRTDELKSSFEQASQDFQFASAVAAFAQKLKDNKYLSGLSYEQIADIARKNRGSDPHNYRGEFVSLVDIAQSL